MTDTGQSGRVDTRPLRTAAAAQAPIVAAGALGSGGLPGLYLALAPQPFGRLDVLIVVALAAAPSVCTHLAALARAVRRGEADTTPWRAARNDRGQPLRTHDQELLARAVAELAARDTADMAGQGEVDPDRTDFGAGATGTRSFPNVGAARSMVAAGRERQRTAPPGGGPSVDPPDFTADWAAEHDQQVALETSLGRGRRAPDQPRRHERRG